MNKEKVKNIILIILIALIVVLLFSAAGLCVLSITSILLTDVMIAFIGMFLVSTATSIFLAVLMIKEWM